MYCGGGLEEKHKKYSDIDNGRSQRGEVSRCVESQYRLGSCCIYLVAAPWSCRQRVAPLLWQPSSRLQSVLFVVVPTFPVTAWLICSIARVLWQMWVETRDMVSADSDCQEQNGGKRAMCRGKPLSCAPGTGLWHRTPGSYLRSKLRASERFAKCASTNPFKHNGN